MIEIIPAIDLIDGKCVRLTQGDYAQKTVYSSDPLDIALQFQDAGIRRLHMVDLDGAKQGKVVNVGVLEHVAKHTSLNIDYGGGIKTDQDIERVLNAGAFMVSLGSIAVKNKAKVLEWKERYGAEVLFLGADVKGSFVAIGGWLEETTIQVSDFIGDYLKEGIHDFFCTDISKDGMLQGASTELYGTLLAQHPSLRLVASGGVSTVQDILDLDVLGCSGVIVGKAFYEGRISLSDFTRLIEQGQVS